MNLETFFNNFDLLADAPNGVQKLRELILQLAVMGKLVPQDANDEPASVLLDKIKAKKERLVKEGIIKKEKPLPVIEADEIPFELPKGWEWVRLEKIANMVHYGYTASANNNITDVRLLRITDIQNNRVNWNNVPGCDIDKNKLDAFKLNDGDLLIARTGGTIGKSYLVENLSICAVFASYLIRITPNTLLLPRYLKIFLESPLYWIQLYAKSMGTGQPNVNATSLKTLTVPFSPLAEQHRIVAKVDELMALCDRLSERQQKRRETRIIINNVAIGQLLTAHEPEVFKKSWQHIYNNFDLLYSTPDNIGKLRQAILQLAVQGKLVPQDENDEPASVLLEKIRVEKERLVKEGKIKKEKPLPAINIEQMPYEIPQGWKWIQLGEIVKTIEYGTSEKSSDIVDEVPVFRMNNIRDGKVLFNNLKYVSASIKDLPRLYLQEKDILFNRTNSYELVGKTGVFTGVSDKYTFASYLIRIQLFLNYVSPELINVVLNSAYFRHSQIEPEITQQCGQANFNGTKLKNAVIPFPPLGEQHRIVAKVNQLMSLCDTLETKLTQSVTDSEKLINAAVHQILAANSNKTDKHESTLLESIHAEITKPETKTARRRTKKPEGQDTEAVQLNLPLF